MLCVGLFMIDVELFGIPEVADGAEVEAVVVGKPYAGMGHEPRVQRRHLLDPILHGAWGR